MTCAHIQSKLTTYLERMCAKSEISAIARHIEICPDCAQELRDLQRVKSLVQERAAPPVDTLFYSDLCTSICERTSHAHLIPGLKARRGASGLLRHKYLLSVGAVVLITALTLGWQALNSSLQPITKTLPTHDDMVFLLQEHALQADQSAFSNGALGSIMVNYPRKNTP